MILPPAPLDGTAMRLRLTIGATRMPPHDTIEVARTYLAVTGSPPQSGLGSGSPSHTAVDVIWKVRPSTVLGCGPPGMLVSCDAVRPRRRSWSCWASDWAMPRARAFSEAREVASKVDMTPTLTTTTSRAEARTSMSVKPRSSLSRRCTARLRDEDVVHGCPAAPVGRDEQLEVVRARGAAHGVGLVDAAGLQMVEQRLVEGLHAVVLALGDDGRQRAGLLRVDDHVAHAA